MIGQNSVEFYIEVPSSEASRFEPSTSITVRLRLTSPYTETVTPPYVDETFILNIESACYRNVMTKTSSPLDTTLTYNVR